MESLSMRKFEGPNLITFDNLQNSNLKNDSMPEPEYVEFNENNFLKEILNICIKQPPHLLGPTIKIESDDSLIAFENSKTNEKSNDDLIIFDNQNLVEN